MVRATVVLLLAASPAASGAEQAMAGTVISVSFQGLRSSKGMLRACLTRDPAHLLHCDEDRASFKASVEAKPGAQVTFSDVPTGDYAIVILHDENGNGKADRMLGIPREGVGFSRNPAMTFGPPSFAAARFHVSGAAMREDIRMKYFL